MLRNEVGCVHTSQGLEFDWVGVFIGKDLRYDPDKKMLFADIDNYHDKGGKNGLGKNKAERSKNLLKYVCRCYRVLWGGARNLDLKVQALLAVPQETPSNCFS